MNEVKQVVVMRTKYPDGKGGTMKPRTGKLVVQGCHAVVGVLEEKPKLLKEWRESRCKKVCLQVDGEEELKDLEAKAKCAGLKTYLVTDAGLTEFDGPTVTCLAIGPDYSDKIDPITGSLKLF